MAECDYDGCIYEETISAWEWRRLREVPQDQDINRGGFCDARLGAINFWCSPEDQPDDPDWGRAEIVQAALNYPRAYVGAVHGQFLEAAGEADPDERTIQSAVGVGGAWTPQPGGRSNVGGQVRLHWIMAPAEKAEAIVGERFMGSTLYEGKEVTAKDFATDADLAWCRAKFQELRELVAQ